MPLDELIQLGLSNYPESGNCLSPITLTGKSLETYLEKHSGCQISYALTDEELYTLFLMEGLGASIVQGGCFCYGNEFQKKCAELFASLLKKAPLTKQETIYRQETYLDGSFFESLKQRNELFVPKHFLTCSKDDFDNSNVKLIIKPNLPNTKAHDIWKIYNHGENCTNPEYQINFEQKTRFSIDDVYFEEDSDKCVVHLTEL